VFRVQELVSKLFVWIAAVKTSWQSANVVIAAVRSGIFAHISVRVNQMPIALHAPPFNSETGSINGKKGNQVRWQRIRDLHDQADSTEQVEAELAHGNSRPNASHIALLRRNQRRWLCCAIAATAIHMQERYMALALEAFNMEQRLLGRDVLPLKSKRSKPSKLSPHDLPMPDPVSQKSGNQGVNPDTAKPASGQATSAVPPDSASDCPF
jgi:hypothetical protein